MTISTIQLPAWLSTGMIFQQGVPLLLYGYAQPHAAIKLEVVKDPTDGRKVSKLDTDYGIILSRETRSDDTGKFTFELPAYKPSTDAYTLLFSSAGETAAVKDLRCGDVWLMLGSVPFCTPICRTGAPRTPLKDSALHLIRFFICSRAGKKDGEQYSYSPQPTLPDASWINVRNGNELAGVSSVGFSLAYHLADQLHYPIGIVDLAAEGSAIYSWISRRSFEADPDLSAILKEKRIFLEETDWIRRSAELAAGSSCQSNSRSLPNPFDILLDRQEEVLEEKSGEKPEELSKVQTEAHKEVQAEVKAEAQTEAQTEVQTEVHTEIQGRPIGNKKLMSELPKPHTDKKIEVLPGIPDERLMTALFNHKLYPLKNMSIRGILFAPDEKDSCFSDQYEIFMRALLTDLSAVFGPRKIHSRQHVPSLILLHVHPGYTDPSEPLRLVNFNESISAVRRKLPMPIGVLSQHDMLMPDKAMTFYIGRRLSFIALGLHFTPKMPTSSPECIGVEVVGNKVMISFDNTSDGLKLAENESILRGFAICGADKVYRPAHAKILHGVRVMVWHDEVSEPKGVTYGYYPIPHNSTFRNRADLPVLPFRFDRSEATYSPDLTFTSCDQLTVIGLENSTSEFAMLPVYGICKGSGKIFLETLNKTEGAGSLRIEYETSDGLFSFEPILRYSSIYAPLDLSSFKRVSVDVFNPDQQTKELMITGFSGTAVIKKGLMWQTLILKYDDAVPMKISTFEIGIKDPQSRGSVYIDNIQFLN